MPRRPKPSPELWKRVEFFIAERDGQVYRRLIYPSGKIDVQLAPDLRRRNIEPGSLQLVHLDLAAVCADAQSAISGLQLANPPLAVRNRAAELFGARRIGAGPAAGHGRPAAARGRGGQRAAQRARGGHGGAALGQRRPRAGRQAGRGGRGPPWKLRVREDQRVAALTPLVFCVLVRTVSPTRADIILVDTALEILQQLAPSNPCFGANLFSDPAGVALCLGGKLDQKRKPAHSVFGIRRTDLPATCWVEVVNYVLRAARVQPDSRVDTIDIAAR